MFAPVWQAYRGQLVFAAALAAYLGATGISLVASNTWLQLLLVPVAGALPFFLAPGLRRFAGVFSMIVIGGLALLAGGELLFRARYFGADAVVHFTGYSPLPPTALPGFLSPSEDPELGYVFTPGATALFNGRRWEINEAGFRARSFSADKPAGVYRILVLGDSFALGAGVTREERFSNQLESILASPQDGARFEVYNLGLAGIGLAQLAHLMETQGPRYRADLVLIGLRASQLHEKGRRQAAAARAFVENREPVAEGFSFPRRYSFVLNVQRDAVRTGLGRAASLLPPWGASPVEAAGRGEAARPFDALVERCAEYTRVHGTPVVLVALRKMEFRSDLGLRATLANRALDGDASRRGDHDEIGHIAARLGVPYIDTYDAFDPDSRRSDYIIFPGDGHPNAAGHRRYAEAIAAWLRDHAVLTRPTDG